MGFNFSAARQASRVPTPPPETVDTPPPPPPADTGLPADAEPPLAKTLYEQQLEPLQAAVTEAEAKVKQDEKAARAGPPIRGHYTQALHEKKEGERPALDVRREGLKLASNQEELQAAVAALEEARLVGKPVSHPGTTLQAPMPISTDPSEAPSKVQQAFSDYLASTGRGRGLDAEQMSEEFANFRLARAKERLFDPNPGKGNHSMVTLSNQIKIMNAEISKAEEDLKALGPTTDMPISFGRTAKKAAATTAALKALQIDRDRAVALYDQMARIAQTQLGMTPNDISASRKDAVKAAEQGMSLEAYQAKVAAEKVRAEKVRAEKARAEASQ